MNECKGKILARLNIATALDRYMVENGISGKCYSRGRINGEKVLRHWGSLFLFRPRGRATSLVNGSIGDNNKKLLLSLRLP